MATTAPAQPAEKETTFWDELNSLKTPQRKEITPAPKVGSKAPKSDKIPLSDGKATVILFLRHCGCPCKYLLTSWLLLPHIVYHQNLTYSY